MTVKDNGEFRFFTELRGSYAVAGKTLRKEPEVIMTTRIIMRPRRDTRADAVLATAASSLSILSMNQSPRET